MYATNQLLLWLSCLSGFALATSSPTNRCKAHPDTQSWPSAQEWSTLNKELGGRLITPTPPAAACHSGQAAFNETQCAIIQKAWKTQDWHTKDPVSVFWDHYTNDTCLPDPKMPCSSKGYPAYVVNASTPEHVKLGVDFGMSYHVTKHLETGYSNVKLMVPQHENTRLDSSSRLLVMISWAGQLLQVLCPSGHIP